MEKMTFRQRAASKTADAAIDCGSAWVVAEVSTAQLKRESVVGGDPVELEKDLERAIYTKARQLDATVRAIGADESKLTSAPAVKGRRIVRSSSSRRLPGD